MKELVLLIGPPGSGKTTYVDNHLTDYVYVNQDSQGKKEHYRKFLMSLLNDFSKIVIDRCNFSKKQRSKYTIPAKYLGYNIKFITMPKERNSTLFNRAISRNNHPTMTNDLSNKKMMDIIKFFVDNYESPGEKEADEVIYL